MISIQTRRNWKFEGLPYSIAHMPVPVATSSTCLGDLTGARPGLLSRINLHCWCCMSVRLIGMY